MDAGDSTISTTADGSNPTLGSSGAQISHEKREANESGTVLSHRSLLQADAFCDAIIRDLPSDEFGDAFRSLGLTHVSFWIQRDPDGALARWEGADIDTLFERFAASSNPVLVRWRGRLRVFSGPQEAESFWEASRDRLLSWATDEQGAESEITVYRGAEQVEAYRQMACDVQADPALYSLLGRVRGRQGFTRVETWQQRGDDDLIMTLLEANNLEDALAQRQAESNEFDQRIMKLLRSMILQAPIPPSTATLLGHWHA